MKADNTDRNIPMENAIEIAISGSRVIEESVSTGAFMFRTGPSAPLLLKIPYAEGEIVAHIRINCAQLFNANLFQWCYAA